MVAALRTDAPFWMVWNPAGRAPLHRHGTELSAITEAERLARANPGQLFIVLTTVCARHVVDIMRIDMRANNEPPF